MIDRYPIEDYKDQVLLPSIPMFCYPDGINLVQWEKGKPHDEKSPRAITFNFVLTSEIGTRTYC